MKQLTAILIGAGARGAAYAQYALEYPHELKFISVAESNPERLGKFAEQHGIPAERQYTSWEQILEEPQMADMAIIATQDRMHYQPTLKALKNKYHVLLEKPMSLILRNVLRWNGPPKRTDDCLPSVMCLGTRRSGHRLSDSLQKDVSAKSFPFSLMKT